MTIAKYSLQAIAVTFVVFGAACFPFKRDKPYPKLQVTAKEGLNVLVSNNARCLVPTKEFATISVGQLHSCNWREAGVAVIPPAAAKK